MKPITIDVREPEEYAKGHVDDAINIPPSQLMSGSEYINGLDKDTPLVLYCVSGSRSNVALQLLKQQGFTNLTNGINADHVNKQYGIS